MQRPWLAHYDPDVVHDVEHRPASLPQLLSEAAQEFPARAALVTAVHAAGRVFSSEVSYAELERQVGAFAGSLARLGVVRGDRVALLLPNSPQFVVAILGALRAGAIAVPFNPLYSAREVESQLRDSGAKVMVAASRFLPAVEKARGATALERVVVTRVQEAFPTTLRALYWLKQARKEAPVRLRPGDCFFSELLNVPAPAPAAAPFDEEQTAVLLYTGGTTGVSKGVELSHRNLVVNAEQNRAWGKVPRGKWTSLGALPLFHAFGLTCGLDLSLLTAGTLVLVPNPTDVAGLAKMIHRFQPEIFPVVPTLLVGISSLPDVRRYRLRSVKVCPCAGSALAPAVQRAFIEKTGIHVAEGFGLTEAAPVTLGNPPFGENRHGTIGVPYPNTYARIVDTETGTRELPIAPGEEWSEPGEIVVKGPQVMKGYWGRPDATAEQLRDGWLHTGDVGQMHRDGYFRIVDRLKDLIIRGGMKIYPAEVEAVLHEHPRVREALVIGVPDSTRGELVKAFVVPRPGEPPTVEELLAFCRENLARYKVPSQIELRAELVRSAVGKPLRRALRDEARAGAQAQ